MGADKSEVAFPTLMKIVVDVLKVLKNFLII